MDLLRLEVWSGVQSIAVGGRARGRSGRVLAVGRDPAAWVNAGGAEAVERGFRRLMFAPVG